MLCGKRKFRAAESILDPFDGLPDDIVLFILCKLSSAASCPSDFVCVLVTCKRMKSLGSQPVVLSRASREMLAVRARNWSEDAHQFLKDCVSAFNVEASYILGMIRFYCLQNRASGSSLMAKAAIRGHAVSLYSLALIQFNGSGKVQDEKDFRAGAALCGRAASLGHVDALRELGHCLQDGYGVPKNVPEGRRLLVQANAKELAWALRSFDPSPSAWQQSRRKLLGTENDSLDPDVDPVSFYSNLESGLWSDFGCSVPVKDVHPANRFLVEWFGSRGGPGLDLRVCSYQNCGRPETRKNEFRRCSGCGNVNYCSRGCQAHDWRMHHRGDCTPTNGWANQDLVHEYDNYGDDQGLVHGYDDVKEEEEDGEDRDMIGNLE